MRGWQLIFLLAACSAGKKPQMHTQDISVLRERYETLRDEYDAETHDRAGWASERDCDGTLWAGIACSAGATVDIGRAEYAPGQIERRPSPSCYPGDSRSTVSNDMFTGYLWCAWSRRDYDTIRRVANYGKAHELRIGPVLIGWIMGEPYPEHAAEVVMRPNDIGLIGRMRHKLSSGEDSPPYRTYPSVFLPVKNDFEKHIQVLSIALNGAVDGKLHEADLDRLRVMASEEPLNPLFAAVLGVYTGNMERAISLLLDPSTPIPSYVRGERRDLYATIHWLRAARFVLDGHAE